MTFDRKNRNLLNSWWWTVDRITLLAILVIAIFGTVMVSAASPAVAERIGLDSFYFVRHQLVYLGISLVLIFGVSLFSPANIRRISVLGYGVGLLMMVVVLFVGDETKGAKRWIDLFGMSLQPSEFVKPLFIVVTAWLLSKNRSTGNWREYQAPFITYFLVVALLISQPDMGMTLLVSAVWSGQLFLAGVPVLWVAVLAVMAGVGLFVGYLLLPHVAFRIDSFLASFDGRGNYQVRKSLEAFANGGLFGKGPGEGVVKLNLPDSHTDFIFAVAGEELGAIACIVVVALFALIVVRGFLRLLDEEDRFIIYAVSGLLMQFGVQAVVNMGVALNLFPTKGMTMPFVSYGGSSMLAISLAMGMMLALTRKRYGVRVLR